MKTLIELIKENIENKELVLAMAKINLDKDYKGSAAGWLWAFVKPAMYICVFWFAISLGFRGAKDIPGINCPYFLWFATGMIAWFYIRDMIQTGANCFRKYKPLVTRMKFPIGTIPTFICLSNFYVHLLLMAGIIIVFILSGCYPTIYWIQLPFYMVCMILMAIVWSFLGGVMTVMSRDFHNLVKTLVTALFWLSGILFDINSINNEWVRLAFCFNPITYIAEGYRNALTKDIWFFEQLPQLGGFLLILVLMAGVAMLFYGKLRKDIPDVI